MSEVGRNGSGKLFRFRLGDDEFCLEICESKKISLCRILDSIAKLVGVKENQIAFLYNGKEIFGLDCLEPLPGTILIHTPSTPVPSIPGLSQLIPKSICKFFIHFQDQIFETWCLAGSRPKISDFLSTLYLDDDYKKIFTTNFDILQNNKKISEKLFINESENFPEFHLKPTPIKNPLDVIFDYPGCSQIKCVYDKNTKLKKVFKYMNYYLGYHKKIILDADLKSIDVEEYGNESLETLNFGTQVIKIKESLELNRKHFMNKIEFNTKAPDYRQVIPGLNFRCLCEVSGCEREGEFVMEKLGYGKFYYNMFKENIRCKMCNSLVKILAFGIFKAYLKLTIFEVPKNYIETFENFQDHYISFDFFLRKFKNVNQIVFECTEKPS